MLNAIAPKNNPVWCVDHDNAQIIGMAHFNISGSPGYGLLTLFLVDNYCSCQNVISETR